MQAEPQDEKCLSVIEFGHKGGVHIMGVNCPSSDPDITHRGQYLDPYMYEYPYLGNIIIWIIKVMYQVGTININACKP